MQWIGVKILFSSNNDSLAVELVADAFFSLKAKGVVVDDPHMTPEEGWASDAVKQPSRPAVTGYFPADDQFETCRYILEQSMMQLVDKDVLNDHIVEYERLNEQDWAESWKTYFHPQKITSRIVVKPTWRPYEPEQDQLIIEIDPGMAFGTGTHPTTALCIHLLEKYLKAGDAILDVGTGSGILLVTASKLGACRLAGVDSDAVALDVTRKNLIQNSIDLSTVEITCGNLIQDVNDKYDLVVANILSEVIIELLDHVAKVLHPGGVFVCSGIIKAFQADVMEKMTSCGFEILEQREQEDWVAFAGRKGLMD